MSNKSRCRRAVKAFQKMLVYEPVSADCRPCEKPRPYPTAPPFGTTIKVCSFGEMERLCFPKICDCPHKEIPLCPDEKRKENICLAFKLLAAATLVAALFDSGILRHPIHTTRLTQALTDRIEGTFVKDKDNEEKEDKPAKMNQSHSKNRHEIDPKWEYETALKLYNLKNVWNAAVIGLMDLCITLAGLPPFLIKKGMEQLGVQEDDRNSIMNKRKGAKPM